MAEQLPIPIHVANNADCAVLGEIAAGAAKGNDDVLLLAIGRGVGSGLVHNGQLFDGPNLGTWSLRRMDCLVRADGRGVGRLMSLAQRCGKRR